MSDQETILQTLKSAESRIRINSFLGRLASGLSIWIGIAILMKTWDLIVPLSGSAVRLFWIVWWAALVPCLWTCRSTRRSLGQTAIDVDRKARLQDELLSAHWFLSHRSASPWESLQIERAAKRIAGLDLGQLFPRALPRTSYIAAGGLVLLLALSYAPLPFAPITGFSEPSHADLSPALALIQEIEDLLTAADELRPDATLGEFQHFIESLEELTLSPTEVEQQLDTLQGNLAEDNLNVASLIEGLEEMGADLMRSGETEAAGQALAEHDLAAAAEALAELGADLGEGRPPAEDLQSALAEAGETDYSGLDQLAGNLSEAAGALGAEGTESGQAVEQALEGAAESLSELADVVESQQLRNQAANRMEGLQELLRQQMAEAQADAGDQAGGEAGQPEAGSPQEGSAGDSAASPVPARVRNPARWTLRRHRAGDLRQTRPWGM